MNAHAVCPAIHLVKKEGWVPKVGDIISVRRGAIVKYHHSLVVISSTSPTCWEAMHLDPNEFGNPQPCSKDECLTGVDVKPQTLSGEDVRNKYLNSDPWCVHRPERIDINEVGQRVSEFRNRFFKYQLEKYNCQHFATEVSTGVAFSFEANAAKKAAKAAFDTKVSSRFQPPSLTRDPFWQFLWHCIQYPVVACIHHGTTALQHYHEQANAHYDTQ